jgi:hypothetical protein
MRISSIILAGLAALALLAGTPVDAAKAKATNGDWAGQYQCGAPDKQGKCKITKLTYTCWLKMSAGLEWNDAVIAANAAGKPAPKKLKAKCGTKPPGTVVGQECVCQGEFNGGFMPKKSKCDKTTCTKPYNYECTLWPGMKGKAVCDEQFEPQSVTGACPVTDGCTNVVYKYEYGQWGSCKAGVSSRSSTCMSYSKSKKGAGVAVSEKLCQSQYYPDNVKPC